MIRIREQDSEIRAVPDASAQQLTVHCRFLFSIKFSCPLGAKFLPNSAKRLPHVRPVWWRSAVSIPTRERHRVGAQGARQLDTDMRST